MRPGCWLLRVPGSPRIGVLPANTDPFVPAGRIPNLLESSSSSVSWCIRSLSHLSISATDMGASRSARRVSGPPRLSPSVVSSGPAPVFSVGSGRCGLAGGVGGAPAPPQVRASRSVSGSRGPGGVQPAVPVTACVLSVVRVSGGQAVVAWGCAPLRVWASVGPCDWGAAGWGLSRCALVGASACRACAGARVGAGHVAGWLMGVTGAVGSAEESSCELVSGPVRSRGRG